jgi:ATP-binding cassette subfamily F protein uup
VEGISARRKRNQGRVRALGELRAERAAQINRQSTAAMAFESGQKSGAKVIEAKNLDLAFGELEILKDFSLTVQRKDRVALVGPNGVGKTTLIKTLLGSRLLTGAALSWAPTCKLPYLTKAARDWIPI